MFYAVRLFVLWFGCILPFHSINGKHCGPSQSKSFAYVGSYTDTSAPHVNGKPGNGIEVFEINDANGELKSIQTIFKNVSGENPTFLGISNNKKFLYSVNEDQTGVIRAFSIGLDGKLTFLNQQSIPGFVYPIHLMTTPNDQYLHVAYYGTGYAVFELYSDGRIGQSTFSEKFEQPQPSVHPRQDAAHAHMAYITSDSRFVYVPDLGSDQIRSYSFNSTTGQSFFLRSISTKAANGPRHLLFKPKTNWVYLVNELENTVNLYYQNQHNGDLILQQSLPTLTNSSANTSMNIAGAIYLDSTEEYVLVSNRWGEETIVSYSIDSNTGFLTYDSHIQVGGHSRDFSVFRKQLYVASQDDNEVTQWTYKGNGKFEFKHKVNKFIGSAVVIQTVTLNR